MGDLPDIERIRAIELGPDDYLVFTLPEDTNQDTFARFHEVISEKLTDMIGERWMIVTSNIDLSVYRLVPVDVE